MQSLEYRVQGQGLIVQDHELINLLYANKIINLYSLITGIVRDIAGAAVHYACKIEFERKVNQHSFLEEGSVWNDMMKKNTPKFHTAYYDLYFKNGVSLYKMGREPEVRQNKVWSVFIAENTIQTNLDSSTSITLKDIQNDLYLLTDSLRKVDWKMGTEIRKIAGFDCRKAVGKIMDSIIVIAFYSDEIMPSGGPESFGGLPGMILGLAIPVCILPGMLRNWN